MEDLLHLVHSDGADRLRLEVGKPPVLVIDRQEQWLEGPAITAEDAQQLLKSLTDTRQRRELREQGTIEFVHRFRDRASFVVRATMREDNVLLEIH